MKQVSQNLRNGLINIEEVPIPGLKDNFILVQNNFSIISAGTEKSKIDTGKKNLLQKAKSRPDLVKKVFEKIKSEGLMKAIKTVNTRLDTPSPLGYSSAGTVVAVGGLVKGIQPGDKVACAGAGYANHAEFISVPNNLVSKIPSNVSEEEAAFTTLGSIAIQGVRLANPLLGETFLVIGLGLIGQLTVQLLKANGCNVIGTDLDKSLVKLAEDFGATGINSNESVKDISQTLTNGHGVDGVIVCAGTSDNSVIEMCGEVTRQKGRVVVVGAVRMDIPRENFFKKEINIVISRSYGPGRYDPSYEEKGNDYPLSYVRFTEQRNMETFLSLLSQKKLDLKNLITHRFTLDEAATAYQLIEGKKTEPYLGILLSYNSKTFDKNSSDLIKINPTKIDNDKIKISFYGAGNYATATLIPLMKDSGKVSFNGLVTATGMSAQSVAKKFDFSYCASDYKEILNDKNDVVAITTRHDTHSKAICNALAANKNVYVEKPLALSVSELEDIHKAYTDNAKSQIMVGFNRRFAPSTNEIIQHFESVKSPLVINIRVNAGFIPADHWTQDAQEGGGRMIGEGCHFIDLASAITKSNVKTIYAVGSSKEEKSALLNDNLCLSLTFENGSIANITYTADGSKAMSKEHIEVFGGGRSAQIKDFKEILLFDGDKKVKDKKLGSQDKGQKSMIDSWLKGIQNGEPCIDYNSLMQTSLATILSIESLSIGMPLDVDSKLYKIKSS